MVLKMQQGSPKWGRQPNFFDYVNAP